MTDKRGSIKDINENCLSEFRVHWQCLENHNQQLWNCRSEERRLNKCVFTKLVRHPMPTCLKLLLTIAEIGEDDTRYAQGRGADPSTDTQYLCVALSFVHYSQGTRILTKISTPTTLYRDLDAVCEVL
jgi:hypothetical protein